MRFRLLVCLTLLISGALCTGDEFLSAQTSAAIDATVKQSLLSLIAELQIKFDRQVAGDQSAFIPQGPINPGLKALGRPTEIWLSAPVTAQGLFNFSSRVFHENGTSDWNLGTLDTGQIATYAYTISSLGARVAANPSVNVPTSNLGTPWSTPFGNAISTFRNPSDLWRTPQIQVNPPSPGPPNTWPLTPPAIDPNVVEFL